MVKSAFLLGPVIYDFAVEPTAVSTGTFESIFSPCHSSYVEKWECLQ